MSYKGLRESLIVWQKSRLMGARRRWACEDVGAGQLPSSLLRTRKIRLRMAAELSSFYHGKGEDDEVCCLDLGGVECIITFLSIGMRASFDRVNHVVYPTVSVLLFRITLQAFYICYSSVYEVGVSHHRPALSYRVF